jgi:aminopeptidase YwaD
MPKRLLLISTSLVLAIAGIGGCSRQSLLKSPLTLENKPQVAEANRAESSPGRSASSPASSPAGSAEADLQKLVALGPRVAGTPVMEQASSYLQQAYRSAGYVTEVQTFTYSKFVDQGSSLTVNNATLAAPALRGSVAARPTGRLVVVPNAGRAADFAEVEVNGAIAVVRRGEIRFLEKAQNAAAAGAAGLVIVNSEPDAFAGLLGGEVDLPVVALSGEQGNSLIAQAQSQSLQATLNANTAERTVTGRNIIAHRAGVTQPELLLGAHYDSVADSPGANDNASGTAVLLDVARQIAQTPLGERVWFVAFDGEEEGLHGSRAFVQQAQPQFLTGLEGMLNFDMVGVNSNLRATGSAALTEQIQLANSSDDAEIATGAAGGDSDHASFAAANVPVLFFTRGMEPNYHSPADSQVDTALLSETTQVAINVMQQLLQ